jgi:hypothetical protein
MQSTCFRCRWCWAGDAAVAAALLAMTLVIRVRPPVGLGHHLGGPSVALIGRGPGALVGRLVVRAAQPV